jgi:hypothetical protein
MRPVSGLLFEQRWDQVCGVSSETRTARHETFINAQRTLSASTGQIVRIGLIVRLPDRLARGLVALGGQGSFGRKYGPFYEGEDDMAHHQLEFLYFGRLGGRYGQHIIGPAHVAGITSS